MKQDVSDVEAFRIIHAKMAFIEQDITTSMYVYAVLPTLTIMIG